MKRSTKVVLIISLLLNIFTAIYFGRRIYARFTTWRRVKNAKILFVGDSRVALGDWNERFQRKDIGNAGIKGATIVQINSSLDSILKKDNVDSLFIQVGVNDIRKGIPVDSVAKSFESLMNSLTAQKKSAVFTSIIPIRTDYTQDSIPYSIINQRTDSLNKWLAVQCGMKKFGFIDVNKVITENGRLKVIYTWDGIHLNEDGYKQVATAINNGK